MGKMSLTIFTPYNRNMQENSKYNCVFVVYTPLILVNYPINCVSVKVCFSVLQKNYISLQFQIVFTDNFCCNQTTGNEV